MAPAVALGLLVALVLGGCPRTSCPSINATCPSPAPSYDTEIGPLIATYCSGCHRPGGSNPRVVLQSYDDVTAPGQRGHVLFQISSCTMPPEGEPAPSAAELARILSWFACCGASDAGTCPR